MLSGALGRNNSAILESENQSKFVQTRVDAVSRHFGTLCESFAGVARKSAKLRDSCDTLALASLQFAQTETISQTLKSALKKFSETVAGIQDYRNCEIQRLENRVVGPLKGYDVVCRSAMDDLKVSFSARDRELKKLLQLQRLQDKSPSDTQMITQAETQLHHASVDSSRIEGILLEQIDSFEKRKVLDLKAALKEFVNIELSFHAKSLEVLTEAYQSVQAIDAELDAEEFRNSLMPSSVTSRLETARTLGLQARDNSTSNLTLNSDYNDSRLSASVPALNATGNSSINDNASFLSTASLDNRTPVPAPRGVIGDGAGVVGSGSVIGGSGAIGTVGGGQSGAITTSTVSLPVTLTSPPLASSLKRGGGGGGGGGGGTQKGEEEKTMNRVSWDLSNESLRSEIEEEEDDEDAEDDEDDDDDDNNQDEEDDGEEEEDEEEEEEEEEEEKVDQNSAAPSKYSLPRPCPSPRRSKPAAKEITSPASSSASAAAAVAAATKPLQTSTPKPASSEPPKKPDRMVMFMAK